MTLPCPAGARGRCRCAEATLFAPAGQKRFRVARLILVCRGGEQKIGGALPIRNGRQTRRGTGKVPRRFTIILRTCKIQLFAPSAHPIFHAVPQGERRALPAPAQGIHPLRIPFWGNRRFLRSPRPPKRRRRQAPARGPAAVYSLYRPLRNETQHPRPIRDGAGMRRLRAKGAVSRHCRRRRRPAARTGPRPLRLRPRPRR